VCLCDPYVVIPSIETEKAYAFFLRSVLMSLLAWHTSPEKQAWPESSRKRPTKSLERVRTLVILPVVPCPPARVGSSLLRPQVLAPRRRVRLQSCKPAGTAS
jgi:hypothetical protein